MILVVKCKRCDWEWAVRNKENRLPMVCPHCNSPYWNKERVRIKKQT